MTETQAREKIVKIMQGWIGCKESDGSHKKIIDIYNAHKPLARNYKVQYTDAWCATTVSAAAIQAGYTDIIPTECSCNQMIALLKKQGIWREDDSYRPSAGDIIFYDWQDSGAGDCTGASEHVGMVEKVTGNTITVIEGNKNDAVGRRSIQVNGRYIRGYGVPKYSDKGTSTGSSGKTSSNTTTSSGTATKSDTKIDAARNFDQTLTGSYRVTASSLNMRAGAGTDKTVLAELKKGDRFQCYGYYSVVNGAKWLYGVYGAKTGYCSSKYLKK